MPLAECVLHRQQRQCGDSKLFEMCDGRRMRERRETATQFLRNTRQLHAETFGMQFVQHHVGRGMARPVAAARSRPWIGQHTAFQ